MRVTKAKIERYKEIYRVQDWRVDVIIKRDTDPRDRIAFVKYDREYKHATITIYPKAIKSNQKKRPSETVRTALHHEFAHIAHSEVDNFVPQKFWKEQWSKLADEAGAEKLAQIVMGLTDE